MNWQPTATLEILRKRADIIGRIREFFAKRNILEVDTPLLSHATVTDPHIQSIPAIYKKLGDTAEKMVYLQTSPEYAMKRLLAAGSGSIYQISKSFRQGEEGKLHNPEFTMLEWYRPGWDHYALMDEMTEFLQVVLKIESVDKMSVAELFAIHLDINPHDASIHELKTCAKKQAIYQDSFANEDVHFWLDLLFIHVIEPVIAKDRPLFLYDFPVSQAALAKIRHENPPVASRFEVYFKGMELANGFHELQDATEQRRRFHNDLKNRLEKNSPAVALDERFLAALEAGLPDCAGVAVGVDRLLMLALECDFIQDVVSFAFEHA